MVDWQEYRLGDLIAYKKGYAFKSSLFGLSGDLVVRVSDTTDDSIDTSLCSRIDSNIAKQYDAYRIKKNDIIISTVGSWPDNPKSIVGKVICVPYYADNALLNQNTVRIRSIKDNHQIFLYYRLKNKDFSYYLISGAQGSANQASITLEDIFSFELKLPTPPEQNAIASVLSALDDKIALLQKQNDTIEHLGSSLFNHYTQQIPASSQTVKLNKFVKTTNGYSYRSVDLQPSDIGLVNLKNFDRSGGFRIDGFKDYVGKYKPEQIAFEGDLIVAHTDVTQEAAILGNPALVINDGRYKKLVISMDLVKVESSDGKLNNAFLYFLMKTREFKYHCLGCSNGTTVLHLSKEAIPTFEFILPIDEFLNELELKLQPLLSKLFNNYKEIRNLTLLRDTLLPKLMSGEVRVKY